MLILSFILVFLCEVLPDIGVSDPVMQVDYARLPLNLRFFRLSFELEIPAQLFLENRQEHLFSRIDELGFELIDEELDEKGIPLKIRSDSPYVVMMLEDHYRARYDYWRDQYDGFTLRYFPWLKGDAAGVGAAGGPKFDDRRHELEVEAKRKTVLKQLKDWRETKARLLPGQLAELYSAGEQESGGVGGTSSAKGQDLVGSSSSSSSGAARYAHVPRFTEVSVVEHFSTTGYVEAGTSTASSSSTSSPASLVPASLPDQELACSDVALFLEDQMRARFYALSEDYENVRKRIEAARIAEVMRGVVAGTSRRKLVERQEVDGGPQEEIRSEEVDGSGIVEEATAQEDSWFLGGETGRASAALHGDGNGGGTQNTISTGRGSDVTPSTSGSTRQRRLAPKKAGAAGRASAARQSVGGDGSQDPADAVLIEAISPVNYVTSNATQLLEDRLALIPHRRFFGFSNSSSVAAGSSLCRNATRVASYLEASGLANKLGERDFDVEQFQESLEAAADSSALFNRTTTNFGGPEERLNFPNRFYLEDFSQNVVPPPPPSAAAAPRPPEPRTKAWLSDPANFIEFPRIKRKFRAKFGFWDDFSVYLMRARSTIENLSVCPTLDEDQEGRCGPTATIKVRDAVAATAAMEREKMLQGAGKKDANGEEWGSTAAPGAGGGAPAETPVPAEQGTPVSGGASETLAGGGGEDSAGGRNSSTNSSSSSEVVGGEDVRRQMSAPSCSECTTAISTPDLSSLEKIMSRSSEEARSRDFWSILPRKVHTVVQHLSDFAGEGRGPLEFSPGAGGRRLQLPGAGAADPFNDYENNPWDTAATTTTTTTTTTSTSTTTSTTSTSTTTTSTSTTTSTTSTSTTTTSTSTTTSTTSTSSSTTTSSSTSTTSTTAGPTTTSTTEPPYAMFTSSTTTTEPPYAVFTSSTTTTEAPYNMFTSTSTTTTAVETTTTTSAPTTTTLAPTTTTLELTTTTLAPTTTVRVTTSAGARNATATSWNSSSGWGEDVALNGASASNASASNASASSAANASFDSASRPNSTGAAPPQTNPSGATSGPTVVNSTVGALAQSGDSDQQPASPTEDENGKDSSATTTILPPGSTPPSEGACSLRPILLTDIRY